MTGVRKSLNWSQSESIAEAVSADSCNIVLETSPAHYVEKISRYLESSVGQTRQDKACDDPAGAESDSGDSLFITQKPVPEAVRTGKRHRPSLRSTPASPRDLEESEDDTSSSASQGECTAGRKRQRQKFRLPKYSFPFLTEKKWGPRSTLLPVQQNTKLHNATMGGFFKCVRELWQGYGSGDVELSLPTLDMDGDYISPLSEKEEEEKSEDEDIKVVEKKRFMAPSKTKCSQPWYTPAKRDDQVKQERKRRRRRAQESLKKMSTKATTSRVTLLSSDADNSDNGHPQREMSDKHMTSDILEQTETPKRRLTKENKKILLQEQESEEDSDATFCELSQLQGSLREHAQGEKEAAVTVTVAQADVFQTDDLSETGREEDVPDSQSLLQSLPEFISHTNDDSVCTEARVMKKKKVKGDHASVEEGKSQSQEEPEGLHAVASVNVEAEETLNPPKDSRAEPPALHADNTLRQEERDFPDSTPTKKKRKRSKSTADNITREVVGNLASGVRLEDSGFSMTSNTENVQEIKRKKKKKLKRNVEDDEGVNPVEEPLNDDSVMQNKKKKKKKKEKGTAVREEHREEDVENTEVCQETLGSSSEKKRRKHKTKKQRLDTRVGEEDGVSVSLAIEGVALEESAELSVKKKKKKKRESISEGVDICYNPDKSKMVENTDNSQETTDGHEDRDAEQVTKKKKKKKREKTSELSSRQVSEDTVAQSGDPGSVQKKEKKRTSSFLDADSEEKDAQSYPQQKSSSTSVAAHVWGKGKAAGDVETESAQTAVTSGDCVSKKKRKRKTSANRENVEEDHKPGFQEPNKTCASALTDTGVKKKKKAKRSESEHVTLMERSDSAADEGQTQTDEVVLLKKKKKKKKAKGETCHVIQENPPAASEEVDSERATQKSEKKDKQLNSSLVSDGKYDHSSGSMFDQASKETLSFTEDASSCSEAPKHQALKGVKDKKKKKKKKNTVSW